MPWSAAGTACVIANGFGTEHTLTVNYAGIDVTTPSPDRTNGWYAQNHGKLALKAIPVSSSGIKYWGGLATKDLVNTARFNLMGVSGSGSLTGSLYALNHTDVPAYSNGVKIASIWRAETNGFTITNANVTFRYDALRVTNTLGMTETDLRVYQHNGTTWVKVPTVVIDPANKTITATNVGYLSWFAVAESMSQQAPVVYAGTNLTTQMPSAFLTLQGSVTDDGLPSGVTNVTWSQLSGAGTVTFGDIHVTNTTASFSTDSTYILMLTGSDGDLTRTSLVQVLVKPSSGNTVPVVGAGTNQTVTRRTSAILGGTVTDDGLPSGITNIFWSRISGPGTVTFGNSAVTNTTATFSMDGTNVLQLWASDTALAASSTVQIVVSTPGLSRYWDQGGAANSNWSTAANWTSDLEPLDVDNAYIGAAGYVSNAIALINQSDEQCKNLILGDAVGTTGTVTMTGGSLTLNETANNTGDLFIGNKGSGRFMQTGGVVSNADHSSFKQLIIGSDTGSSGSYQLDNGTIVGFSHLNVGVNGVGTFVQNAGSLITNLTYLDVGWSGGGQGTYTMNGGDVYVDTAMSIASSASGSFTQNAGRVTMKSGASLNIGSSGWTGSYTLEGGALTVGGMLSVGAGIGGTGTLDIGSSAAVTCSGASGYFIIGNGGIGRCIMRGGTLSVLDYAYAYISASGTDQGTVQGWGSINVNRLCLPWTAAGTGLVIADGSGTDRTLAVNYSQLQSLSPAPARTNGWYAQNHGKLLLSPIAVSGSGIKYWGGATSPDLVNTVTLNLTGVTGSGAVTGALYALNHSAVPKYSPNNSKVVGIWGFDANNFSFTNLTMTFRYDATNAVKQGIQESNLRVYQYDGDRWMWKSASGVNTELKTIVASNLTTLGFFAVAERIQLTTPGTIFTIR